jgi:hypothetical protein
MGVLVNGADKVEQSLKRVKRKARSINNRTKNNANAKLGRTWTWFENSLKSSPAKPYVTGVKPLRDQLDRDVRAFVKRVNSRTRTELKGLIDRTIVELEKAKRKLDHDTTPGWSAA